MPMSIILGGFIALIACGYAAYKFGFHDGRRVGKSEVNALLSGAHYIQATKEKYPSNAS